LIKNKNMDNDIRPPDSVVRERLQEDIRSQYEKDLELALSQSMDDMHIYEQQMKDFEQAAMQQFEERKMQREKDVKPILALLERLARFDEKSRELLNILDPILVSYQNCVIDNYVFDEITYNYIVHFLKLVRLTEEQKRFLESIILC